MTLESDGLEKVFVWTCQCCGKAYGNFEDDVLQPEPVPRWNHVKVDENGVPYTMYFCLNSGEFQPVSPQGYEVVPRTEAQGG